MIQLIITLILALHAEAQFFNFFGQHHQEQHVQKQNYEDEFLNSEY